MFYDKNGRYFEDYSNYVIKYILESNLKDSHKLSIIKNINDIFFDNLKGKKIFKIIDKAGYEQFKKLIDDRQISNLKSTDEIKEFLDKKYFNFLIKKYLKLSHFEFCRL